jgi:phage tail protein X
MKKRKFWLTIGAFAFALLLMTTIVGQAQAKRVRWSWIDDRAVALDDLCPTGLTVYVLQSGLFSDNPIDDLYELDELHNDDDIVDIQPLGPLLISVFRPGEDIPAERLIITEEEQVFRYNPMLVFADYEWFVSDSQALIPVKWSMPMPPGSVVTIFGFNPEFDDLTVVPGRPTETEDNTISGTCSKHSMASPKQSEPPMKPDSPVDGMEVYKVHRGDTLAKVAEKVYGDSSCWRPIYDANRNKLSSPNIIYAGMTLTIPPKPAYC